MSPTSYHCSTPRPFNDWFLMGLCIDIRKRARVNTLGMPENL